MGNTNKPLEMRIFLCGCYSLNILDFLLGNKKREIIDSHSSKIMNKELGWEYILLENGDSFNGESLYKYVFDKIQNIILSKKIKNKKNLVIYIIRSEEEAKGMLSNFINENDQYHPIFLFVCLNFPFTEIENNIYNYLEGTKLSKDNVIMVNYDENNNNLPLLQNILKVCSYYNELGDEFVFPPTACPEDIQLNLAKYEATFNSMVIGKPGSGKSTFINKVLQANKCRTGKGHSVTTKITKYIHDQYPIIFYDVPGFTNSNDLSVVNREIKKLGEYMKKASTKIDIIFYLIDLGSARTFFDFEINGLLEHLKNLNTPIFFVITKSRTREKGEDFKKTIKINLIQDFGQTHLTDNIYYIEMVEDHFGLFEMFQGVCKIFEESLLRNEDFNGILPGEKEYNKKVINVLKKSKFFNHYNSYNDLLNKCYYLGLAITGGASLAALAIGASPLPFTDIPILCGLEIALIIGIASCYGIKIDKAQAKQYLGTLAAAVEFAGIGMALGNLKILPVIGIVFSGINGVIAGVFVANIGIAANEIFYEQAKKKDFKEIVLSHMKCYRDALNYMKNFRD